jgi:hypothetical protein
MSVQPGTYNISLQRRADYIVTLQFKDATATPINLTGWTVAAQVWNQARATKYADFTVTYTNVSTGTIAIALTDTQTTLFPDEAYYDVLLTNPSGLKEYYLEGIIYVSEGYTASKDQQFRVLCTMLATYFMLKANQPYQLLLSLMAANAPASTLTVGF